VALAAAWSAWQPTAPRLEPFRLSEALGSVSIRQLIKAHGGHYVSRMFPDDSGIPGFHT
jgi:hypothetical protein